ncbi:MAG TPA: hypothetical protein VGN57_13240 [Pirellulaceae bacterium]|nr:hypothetical protein [Pirellulaceae bacterium]
MFHRNPTTLFIPYRLFLLAAVLFSANGCSTEIRTDAPSASIDPAAPQKVQRIDAGIILSGRDNYVCFPADAVGIRHDARIVGIKTSCDCVQIAPILTVADGATSSLAFDLFFPADPEWRGRRSMRIECEATYADGETSPFEILCVCTSVADDSEAP